MTDNISDIAFTESIKEIQARKGSREAYAKVDTKGGWSDEISDDLTAIIETRDSFYLGTASADGQPYIQHRGGKAGFLKVIDRKTLAFADFRGNRQYISTGNLAENNKAYIFLMDYTQRRRIKIWGTPTVIDDDPVLLKRLADEGYKGVPEQAIRFEVKAWDVNCPQHIQRRYTDAEFDGRIKSLEETVESLRAERDELRTRLREVLAVAA